MLSLQDKLDQIAREREVLAVRMALALQGLREGDTVRNVHSGALGHLAVVRDSVAVAAVVRTESGEEERYVAEQWRPP